jgi:hypothetical protein
MWWVAIGGVPLAYLGIHLHIDWLMWGGIVLSFPLLVTVLPLCIFLIVAAFTAPFWVPIYELRVRLHGAPFKPGDHVRIVRGEHRGKVVAVRDVWVTPGGCQVEAEHLPLMLGLRRFRTLLPKIEPFLRRFRLPERSRAANPDAELTMN